MSGALLIAPAPAAAHAELTRSDPAPDAVLASAPSRVTLWFSEEPELRFSEIQVVDRTRRQVDQGGARADPADRLALSVGLGDLAPGTYTVSWKALSTVDGHVTRGVFVFTVGLDQVPTGAVVGGETEGSTATPDRVAVRLLTYVGLALLVGVFPFLLWVLLPGFTLGAANPATTALALRRAWALACGGLVLALLAAVAGLVAQTATVFGVPLTEAIGGRMLELAFGTRFGALWWARMALVAALGAVVLVGRRIPPWPPLLRHGAVLGVSVLFVHALATHAAAVLGATPAAVALDWVHTVAMATWVGGLSYLLLTLWTLARGAPQAEGIRVAAHLVPRFSIMAAVCVGTLLFTGVYQSWLHVGSLPALVSTPYGQALLVKLGLIVPLLGLGALNLLVLSPRLRAAVRVGPHPHPSPRLGGGAGGEGHRMPRELAPPMLQTVAGEVAFALGALVAVGVMANMQPAREALAAQGIARSASAEDLRATVRVQPGLAAVNRFDVFLTDRSGQAVADAQKVALRFTMQTMDMGESELTAAPRGDGHYAAQGGNLAMAGPWRIELLVRRAGRDDVRAAVTVSVDTPPPPNVAPAAPRTGEGNLILGIEVLLLAGGAVGYMSWTLARRKPMARWAPPIGVFTVILGGGLAVHGALALSGTTVRNPVPPSAASVARGAAIYAQYCAVCHGDTGRGDGPAGFALNPRPADLAVHLAAGHTDAQLFDWITNGFPGTAMPGWKDELSEEDRWHVLNYIQRSFARNPRSP